MRTGTRPTDRLHLAAGTGTGPSPTLLPLTYLSPLRPAARSSCAGRRTNNPSLDELHQPPPPEPSAVSPAPAATAPPPLPLVLPLATPPPLFHARGPSRGSCPSGTPAAFDAYFHGADLERGDRISGQDAAAFFKGSGMPQPVPAQVQGSHHIHACALLGATTNDQAEAQVRQTGHEHSSG